MQTAFVRRLALACLFLGACTQNNPLRDINADEGSIAPDNSDPPPIVATMATTPYQGVVALEYPAVAVDAVPIDAGGAAGVGAGVDLVASLPGGTFCSDGTLHGGCCLSLSLDDVDPALPSAGTLTVLDASDPAVPPTHGHHDDDGYSLLPPDAYAIGDQMTVSASGSPQAIHAFSATAAIPAPMVGLPPEFQDSDWGTLGVSRSNNWTFHWTPAGASFVDIAISGDVGSVECRVSDTDGELVISAATLTAIATSDAVGFASAYRGNSASIAADNLAAELDVTISAGYAALQF